MIILEILALMIVVMAYTLFGGYGIFGILGLLILWQLFYRVKNGYWMQGHNHCRETTEL